MEDVRLMKEHIGAECKDQSCRRCIRSKEDMEQCILKQGCSRIGTSSAISMLQDGE